MMKIVKSYWSLFLMILSLLTGLMLGRDADNRITLLLLILIIFGFIFFIQWLFVKKGNERLKKTNVEAELELLKNQLDPHFYFNTLNNLYGLAKRKSEKTPEVIMKLSEIMRYVIYKGKEDKVSIEEEVNYLENYLELQEIRINKIVDVNFEKDISNINAEIAPLLLIIPLENAFKHGVDSLIDNAYIHILLQEVNDELLFEVKNNFDIDEHNNNIGIGLENLRKRLALLYKNKYSLETTIDEKNYIFKLKIQL